MNIETYIEDLVRAAGPWVYPTICAVAALEAFVLTSYLVNGTIAFVLIGVFVAHGTLDPALAVGAVYLGTLVGDAGTFALSHRLQGVAFIRKHLAKVDHHREPLQRRPARFIVAGHLTPYLRALLPLLAAGIVPWRKWLAIELGAAALSSCFFVGIGYFAANAILSLDVSATISLVGLVALAAIALFWLGLRSCPLRRSPRRSSPDWRRALWFYAWYPLWYPIRKAEAGLRSLPGRRLRQALREAFPDVRPGDIFLIRLHAPAPWGKWAHSAIAVDRRYFCHGFAKRISEHSIAALPVRYAIVHLRVRCAPEVAAAAANRAREQVGKPVSLRALRGEWHRFSCASLIANAYAVHGVELGDPARRRVVPDDLYFSTEVEILRLVHTEQITRTAMRIGPAASEVGNAQRS